MCFSCFSILSHFGTWFALYSINTETPNNKTQQTPLTIFENSFPAASVNFLPANQKARSVGEVNVSGFGVIVEGSRVHQVLNRNNVLVGGLHVHIQATDYARSSFSIEEEKIFLGFCKSTEKAFASALKVILCHLMFPFRLCWHFYLTYKSFPYFLLPLGMTQFTKFSWETLHLFPWPNVSAVYTKSLFSW